MDTNNFGFDFDALAEKDRDHMIHPWVDLGLTRTREPLIVVEGEGATVTDAKGHRMIDGIGGMWCVNVGYGRNEIAEAIAEQARRLCYFSPFGIIATPPSIDFAARLAAYAPGDLKHVFFTTGGSTAVDSALRFVSFRNNFLGKPKKKHIITREYAYHGSTLLSASVSGKPADRGNMDLITDYIHHLPVPNPYRRPEGMSLEAFCDAKVADLENKILELGPENVACFIAEPLLASGGVIVPPPGYQRRTWEICRKHDVLYISDEVVTGFGRLGHVFASKPVFDIEPDIITCAKGLTSGYVPLGAMLVSDRLFADLTATAGKGQFFANGYTYSAHPVACAAGMANLDIIEREDICGRVRENGPYFQQRMAELLELDMVGDVRGSQFMVCVELSADKKNKTVPPTNWDYAWRIFEKCRPKGLMVRPLSHLVILSPPLVITRAQIDETVEVLKQGIQEVADDLTREGLRTKA
ncbi:aminotransferase [Dongia sedimenti]|uniref:Aminotransferase n=1 Tax=Dongia sedimenti TaxID=3064282 RepID=A0ABU0YMU6_9PROT|nr:aminotransferase [Rhodospirillaceae bacterium R-7]